MVTAMVVVVVVMVMRKWRVSCRWRRNTTLAAAAAVAVRAASGHLAQHLPVSSAHGALPLPDLRRRRRGGGVSGGLHVCDSAQDLCRDQTNRRGSRTKN